MSIFSDNMDYLFGLAKKAGFSKKDVCKQLGIDETTPGKWKLRGTERIHHTTLILIKQVFQPYVNFTISKDILFNQNMRKYNQDTPRRVDEDQKDYKTMSDREWQVIFSLRRWPAVNREALFNYILKIQL
jgi:hypothetical protein